MGDNLKEVEVENIKISKSFENYIFKDFNFDKYILESEDFKSALTIIKKYNLDYLMNEEGSTFFTGPLSINEVLYVNEDLVKCKLNKIKRNKCLTPNCNGIRRSDGTCNICARCCKNKQKNDDCWSCNVHKLNNNIKNNKLYIEE